MRAKGKANELYNKFNDEIPIDASFTDTSESANLKIKTDHIASIQCAIIAVDEIINDLNFTHIGYAKDIIQGYQKTKRKFWNEVKQELINMK